MGKSPGMIKVTEKWSESEQNALVARGVEQPDGTQSTKKKKTQSADQPLPSEEGTTFKDLKTLVLKIEKTMSRISDMPGLFPAFSLDSGTG